MKMIDHIPNLYKIIPLDLMRKTKGVRFDTLARENIPRIDGIDRVLHSGGAVSPGSVPGVERPWYMHPHQDDNLMVFHGIRHVEIYTPAHGKIERFTVLPDKLYHNDELVYDGSAMLVWPTGVFHRIRSDEQLGSASVNFATHYEGFDIEHEFDVYDVNIETGEYWVVREGHLDQPGKK
jgi:hypothetical protein